MQNLLSTIKIIVISVLASTIISLFLIIGAFNAFISGFEEENNRIKVRNSGAKIENIYERKIYEYGAVVHTEKIIINCFGEDRKNAFDSLKKDPDIGVVDCSFK